MKQYYVYIASNWKNSVLYTGITNDLSRRMNQHKRKIIPGFTSKYNVNKLVYYDVFCSSYEAICAEKRIKGWLRSKKIQLIKSKNLNFEDLLSYLSDNS